MNIRKGCFRRVLVLERFVIKIPRGFNGILVNINEYYNWIVYKEYRNLVAPTCFSFFGLFNIMKTADINCVKEEDLIQYSNEVMARLYHPMLNDITLNNLGVYNSKVVKVDYGNDYWLFNIINDLKNKKSKLFNKEK